MRMLQEMCNRLQDKWKLGGGNLEGIGAYAMFALLLVRIVFNPDDIWGNLILTVFIATMVFVLLRFGYDRIKKTH